ncbi:hypothetical protein CEXT_389151 [Caerostris extrusa]|uniref:Uncharacterized protein n=1 Tax=Caerostris extrusa TaxID=172846 RepID=A0AAV4TBM5_CAEEX|nr:hypothetical protein CEXT_389151 [Caerostris extrusa]
MICLKEDGMKRRRTNIVSDVAVKINIFKEEKCLVSFKEEVFKFNRFCKSLSSCTEANCLKSRIGGREIDSKAISKRVSALTFSDSLTNWISVEN